MVQAPSVPVDDDGTPDPNSTALTLALRLRGIVERARDPGALRRTLLVRSDFWLVHDAFGAEAARLLSREQDEIHRWHAAATWEAVLSERNLLAPGESEARMRSYIEGLHPDKADLLERFLATLASLAQLDGQLAPAPRRDLRRILDDRAFHFVKPTDAELASVREQELVRLRPPSQKSPIRSRPDSELTPVERRKRVARRVAYRRAVRIA